MTGVYAWIRDGVRRAVLLGFSDAVEQLGLPAEGEQYSPALAAVLRPAREARPGGAVLAADRPGRKRLGRSLGELSEDAKPA